MDPLLLSCGVGPLLYCPAAYDTAANSIIKQNFGKNYSFALCLEDTIGDDHVTEAENQLINSLNDIFKAQQDHDFYIPKIFIRVREPEQITRLLAGLSDAASLVQGFIIPKITLENIDYYIHSITEANSRSDRPIYIMPILESPTMIHLQHRYEILYGLKEKLDKISDLVLNIRVGGNDLCHSFGFRRSDSNTIYDIRPVADILTDIITVFGMDYIISGPVWEYYNGENWDKGLKSELQMDRLNGFVGKTVIHPKQIPLVNEAYMVSSNDYEDAVSILDWKPESGLLVSGNSSMERMNEYKTHYNWAKRIIALSSTYGILK